ncbi:uncharacterized protein L201_002028 [Kwoniella dendrophila CBS 6074]|uniref:PhoD-like phosphatase metallophosphatase domain-containing protein n=1 Tax=Kwoniella dendrophila CBS 6074 TaxID=1295534 RepID=A0AAX4JP27_9TREE
MFGRSLRLACIASSLITKWNAYVFLRLLPSGPKYLSTIYTAAIIYIISFLLNRTAAFPKRSPKSKIVDAFISLIGGSYSSRYPLFSWLGAFITLLAPLCCLDFVYRTHLLLPESDLHFSRVGWVTNGTANLLIRKPDLKDLVLSYGPVSDERTTIQLPPASFDSDYTIPIQLENLLPDTVYHYQLNGNITGSFTTRRNHNALDKFTILSSSCLEPGWPYNPLDHPLAVKGFTHLDTIVKKMDKKPEAMLFLGDFIYSDLPAPASDYTTSYYRELYRQVYASPSWTPLLRSIPWIHMFDDHEIINDFSPDSSLESTRMFENAMEPYISYQGSVNPPPLNPSQPTYFSHEMGKVSFFILDNRSYRSTPAKRPGSNSTAGYGERSMLGQQQLKAVKDWIELQGRKEGRLLVLVSGVPVTRNWSEGRDELDSWAGYLDEREIILGELWSIGGAVIISGDRHEHATTLLPPPKDSAYPYSSAVIEFSTSPLSFFHLPWTREYVAHPPTDLPIHHQWKGDSRFGVFDFDTSGEQPQVHFELIVDGEKEWEYDWVKGKSVDIPAII